MMKNTHNMLFRSFFEGCDIASCDILIFCAGPLSQKRLLERVSSVCGRLKRGLSCSMRLVFCDSPALDIPPDVYKRIIRACGVREGLFEDDMVFTSDIGPSDSAKDAGCEPVFALSDIYISPAADDEKNIISACLKGNLPLVFDGECDTSLIEKLGGYILREGEDYSSLCSKISADSRVGVKKHLRSRLLL